MVVPSSVWHSESNTYDLFLIRRLLSNKAYYTNAFPSTLVLAFNPIKGIEIKFIEEVCFLIHFFHPIDRSQVLEGCSRSSEENLIMLSSIADDENPYYVNLDWAVFHVQVYDLPVSKMTNEMARFIGN